MIVPGSANSLLLAGGGYQISRSVRLRSSATAYFNKTFGTPTNEKIWTWSAWVKRGSLGVLSSLFNASTGASPAYDGFRFNTSDQLQFFTGGAVTVNLVTTAVFRDPSAWYHVVLSYNATTTTVTIYVNGVAQTTTGTTVSNTTYSFNHASTLHSIGAQVVNGAYTAGTYFDGYLTEINFVDGQALTPSSFGETDSITGVWKPKKYTGTYGTNGFYLNFSDNSAATAAAIGKDYSGNGNNWTPNNISVTAGTIYDSMLDVPTPWADGGNGRGNYSVLNPLDVSISQLTLSDANLTATQPSTGTSRGASSTFRMSTGKWYFEAVTTVTSGTQGAIGIADNANATATYGIYKRGGATAGLSGSPTFSTYTNGDNIGVAFDADARTVSFYKNGVLQGTGGYTYTGTDPVGVRATVDASDSTGAWQLNFGQRPFTYTPPTGFKALNTQNLPTPTIANGAKYMAATLYTGNGATGQSVVNSGNNTAAISFKPDFVWVKVRSTAGTDHYLADSVRGATKYLQSDTTAAEGTNNGITAFNSNGFSVGAVGDTNTNGATIVGWQWQAGAGTTSSNTAGSITSTVSVGATQGFSVVTYTGNATANATVGHGLGVAPKMILIKSRSSVTDWNVYNANLSTPNDQFLRLNTTDAASTASGIFSTPTSTVFGFTSAYSSTNANGVTYVAYCFAAVKGFSAFGSYTGNGSTDGPFIYCGFRPRFVIVKRTDGTGIWLMQDTSRGTYNVVTPAIEAQTSNAEFSFAAMDILSNGFKIRLDNANTAVNATSGNYIYAAFAENPFNYSLAR